MADSHHPGAAGGWHHRRSDFYRSGSVYLHAVLIGLLVVFIVAARPGGTAKAEDPAPQQPHPDAAANSHAAGDVDRPELVPFVVEDPAQLPGIVVDETQARLVGDWQYSTHTPPWVGLGYLHDRRRNKGHSSVTFQPEIPAAGRYDVRLSHCYNSRRATNTPITIRHADGETTIRIDQQQTPPHGRLFRSLGQFRFTAGRSGWVRISNQGTDGFYVIADAVQWIPVTDP